MMGPPIQAEVPAVPGEEELAAVGKRIAAALAFGAGDEPTEADLSAALAGAVSSAARAAELRSALGGDWANRLLRLSGRAGLPGPVQELCAELSDALLAGGLPDATPFNAQDEMSRFNEEQREARREFRVEVGSRRLEVALRIPNPHCAVRVGRSPIPCIFYPGAEVLARLLLSAAGAAEVAGRRVLELGAGCHGLPSLAAAVAGAAEVLATDVCPHAVELLRRNLGAFAAARPGGELAAPGAAQLDWLDREHGLGLFDIVLGSEVVHERGMGALLLGAIDSVLAPDGVALLTSPCARSRFGVQEFQAYLAESEKWQADIKVAEGELVDGLDTQEMVYEVWRIRRRGTAGPATPRSTLLGS